MKVEQLIFLLCLVVTFYFKFFEPVPD